MKTADIRRAYLSFYEKKGHKLVASDSLLPLNDPTLLFTGAGMNQFKEYFLGIKNDFSRATSSQKCLRTGDLDNVGRTAYHHSFFEMLGNFSFGDYFKEEAITWAWELLTKELGIDASRLSVSVHTSDDEAYAIWKDGVGISEKRIYRFGDKDNFWPSNAPKNGPNGPCGPCSEIFFDQGIDPACRSKQCDPSCDCNRYAEIWNLVFTQYERKDGGKLVPLPAPNIDTGMGLERVACILQEKKMNYEIDIFKDTIQEIVRRSVQARADFEGSKSSIYAIADHVRAAVFCIADGAYPSNEGRGYVVRKLIRRAVWHAHLIGIKDSFLPGLFPFMLKEYASVYRELSEQEAHILEVLSNEEDRFRKTVEGGMALLENIIIELQKKQELTMPGATVFKLYDTFGFPDELTRLIAQKHDMVIDQAGFDICMNAQRLKAKESNVISDSIFTVDELDRFLALLDPTIFVGYFSCEEEVEVTALFKDGMQVDMIEEGETGIAILNTTPFYAESGGQIGDIGMISVAESVKVRVLDTLKKDAIVYHRVTIEEGKLKVGVTARASVDCARRKAIRANHTATHLLQAALRAVLGEHVRQLGSLVSDKKFRFDFSYPKGLTDNQIAEVTKLVNGFIAEDIPVQTVETTVEEAKKLGALAFFGDRYDDVVRLISVGDISKELCGGTHAMNTGDLERFVLISESSSASGIRRIEGATGSEAALYLKEQDNLLSEKKKKKQDKEFEKKQRIERCEQISSAAYLDSILAKKKDIAGKGCAIITVVENLDQGLLRTVYDGLKTRIENAVIVLLSAVDGRIAILVGLTKDSVSSGWSANDIVQQVKKKEELSGGGKPAMAFAGSKDLMRIDEIASQFEQVIVDYIKER